MDVDSPHDFISELPRDIVEAILAKLPIKYAVRTCVLSKSWRNKWTSMTHITFDDDVNPSNKPFASRANRFIDGFLSKHDGPIHEFNLSTGESDGPELDKWLLRVCQKDVRELDIRGRGPHVKATRCIFSCKKLTRLKLAWCIVKPPPSFEGFLRMKHLVLFCTPIPREDMERLISSCPLLENLTLDESLYCELAIRAPNLKCLNLRGYFGDVCLENAPLLADMTIAPSVDGYLDFGRYYDPSSHVYLGNLLGGVPKLEKLCGESYFTRCLSAWSGGWKFITYEFLKHIDLSSVRLDNPKEVWVLIQLIFSSPNLQELYIQVRRPTRKFKTGGEFSWYWLKDQLLAYHGTLNRLKQVEIKGTIHKCPVLMELIRFLLSRSPSLAMMRIDIQLSSRPMAQSRKVTQMMSEQLSNFPRASPKALILFPE